MTDFGPPTTIWHCLAARDPESKGVVEGGERLGAEVEVSIGEPRFGWDEIPLAYPMDTAALPAFIRELAEESGALIRRASFCESRGAAEHT